MKYDFTISGPIGQEFDWWTGERGTTAVQVRDFLATRADKETHIAVCSPGGFVDDGLEIYQAIADHGDVHIHILGMTASAATVLCMGAKTIDMSRGSLMLIHNSKAAVDEWEMANKERMSEIVKKLRHDARDLATIDGVMADLYATRCGRPAEEIEAKMKEDAWMSADDALAFGLIDSIREDDENRTAQAAASSRFGGFAAAYGLPPAAGVEMKGGAPRGFMSWLRTMFTTQTLDNMATNQPQPQAQTEPQPQVAAPAPQEANARVGELEAQVADLTARNMELEARIAERDAQIAAMQAAPGDTTQPAGAAENETTATAAAALYAQIKDL